MKIISILALIALVSCSFKSKDSSDDKTQYIESFSANEDMDGDQVSDREEAELGRNPFVANIPELKAQFLQNYKISIEFPEEKAFEIDTKVERGNPHFKFRVGKSFIKEDSLNNAARIGRFSGVSWGSIYKREKNWISFPRIDQQFFLLKNREYSRKAYHSSPTNIKIDLESTFKLPIMSGFESIEKVKLGFYYYSYSKKEFVEIKEVIIKEPIQAGVQEIHSIEIENVPNELIEENYFRRGEFIISEIKDFYIPELKTTKQKLLKSISSKTVPLYYSNPLVDEIFHVAVNSDGELFSNVLNKVFGDKFSIKSGKLIQLEQFSNNLPDFRSLIELRSNNKKGNWFVMTNKLKKHYLSHRFKPSDTISLNYISGRELATRANELIYSKMKDQKSGENGYKIGIGNITENSSVYLSVFLNNTEGRELITESGVFSFSPPNCRNCTGNDWGVLAKYKVNTFNLFENIGFPFLEDDFGNSITLYINNQKINLDELLENDWLKYELKGPYHNSYFHIELKQFDKWAEIDPSQENVLYVELQPRSKGKAGEGIELVQIDGTNIDKVHHAGMISFNVALERKKPIAVTSWKYEEWKHKVPWNQTFPGGWSPSVGEVEAYWEGIDVDIISVIQNNYN